jgi:hypothetical protein
MWLEVEDGAGNVTVQALGSIKTALPVPLFPYPPTSLHSFSLSLNNDTATVSGMAYGNGEYYVGWADSNYGSDGTPRSAFNYSTSDYWFGSMDSSLTGGYTNNEVWIGVRVPGPIKLYFVRLFVTNSMYVSGRIPSRIGISGQNTPSRFGWTWVGGGQAVYEQYEHNGELGRKADFPVNQSTYAYYSIWVSALVDESYPAYFKVPWIQLWGHE